MTRYTYEPGKIDYNNSGRKNCATVVEWEIKPSGELSMTGGIWNPRRSDYYACGQMIDEIAKHFPHDKKLQRMAAIWERWHLNQMRAGSPAQMAWLRANPHPRTYEGTRSALGAAGLDPDPAYLHNGKPYAYGSAWLREELPPEVVHEIVGWSIEPADVQTFLEEAKPGATEAEARTELAALRQISERLSAIDEKRCNEPCGEAEDKVEADLEMLARKLAAGWGLSLIRQSDPRGRALAIATPRSGRFNGMGGREAGWCL